MSDLGHGSFFKFLSSETLTESQSALVSAKFAAAFTDSIFIDSSVPNFPIFYPPFLTPCAQFHIDMLFSPLQKNVLKEKASSP